jgi:hypothetical protein
MEPRRPKLQRRFIPDEGFEISDGKIALVTRVIAVTKAGIKANIEELSIAFMNFLRRKKNEDGINTLPPSEKELFTATDFEPYTEKFLYKYINEESLKRILEGKFRLGTLGLYRNIENQFARDIFEGNAGLLVNAGARQIFTFYEGASNYYIFCSTSNGETPELVNPALQNKFGNVLIRIELEPFMDKIASRVNALSYKTYYVKYSDAKCFDPEINVSITDEMIEESSELLEEHLYLELKNHCFFPHLFIKPWFFQPELEIRTVFEVSTDVRGFKQLSHPGLAKYVKIVAQ